MPRSAASDLGLHCLPMSMSHKKDTRLIWVNVLVAFFIQKDGVNVVCCAYKPAAASCITPANEKQCYLIMLSFRQNILPKIYDIT